MSWSLLRIGVVATVASLTLAGCGVGSTSIAPAPTEQRAAVPEAAGPRISVGHLAWVSVSVATLWRSPDSPRPVDAPALAKPARIVQWLSDMTLVQRRQLSGLADTQALLGDRVRVLRLRRHWVKVAVPSQPSPLDDRGYPGWVPRRQLTPRHPAAAERRATVVTRTAWLRSDGAEPTRLFRVSFGTGFPVVAVAPRFVRVVSPTGVVRRLARSAVVIHAPAEPARDPSRRSLVRMAKSFLGLRYLWAGASGFGLDCSGLTWLDHRVHGITIPRDALPQSRHGRAVAHLRRADLMFYASDGVVHHVSMYVGNGKMIHAPGTGETVRIVPTSTLSNEYVRDRRYLP